MRTGKGKGNPREGLERWWHALHGRQAWDRTGLPLNPQFCFVSGGGGFTSTCLLGASQCAYVASYSVSNTLSDAKKVPTLCKSVDYWGPELLARSAPLPGWG